MRVLALWNKGILNHRSFVSVVEDKVLNVYFKYGGKQTLQLDGQEIEADYYKMIGNEEREFWYDSAGRVVRVKFQRSGSDIEYVLNKSS